MSQVRPLVFPARFLHPRSRRRSARDLLPALSVAVQLAGGDRVSKRMTLIERAARIMFLSLVCFVVVLLLAGALWLCRARVSSDEARRVSARHFQTP